jgi:hypothetical protein
MIHWRHDEPVLLQGVVLELLVSYTDGFIVIGFMQGVIQWLLHFLQLLLD